ncbi:hypothetical protein RTE01_00180 [Raoultella terrigena]|nr:hypothetical protein RTE01_00180 [Raoultella terrigena]
MFCAKKLIKCAKFLRYVKTYARKKTASAHSHADVVRRRDPADINAAAQRPDVFPEGQY